MPPLYEYQCPKCGSFKADMRTIDEREDGPLCHFHRAAPTKMTLVISAVRGIVKNPAAGHTRRV